MNYLINNNNFILFIFVNKNSNNCKNRCCHLCTRNESMLALHLKGVDKLAENKIKQKCLLPSRHLFRISFFLSIIFLILEGPLNLFL